MGSKERRGVEPSRYQPPLPPGMAAMWLAEEGHRKRLYTSIHLWVSCRRTQASAFSPPTSARRSPTSVMKWNISSNRLTFLSTTSQWDAEGLSSQRGQVIFKTPKKRRNMENTKSSRNGKKNARNIFEGLTSHCLDKCLCASMWWGHRAAIEGLDIKKIVHHRFRVIP